MNKDQTTPLVVYHHNDLDGHTSAAVVGYFNPDRNITYHEVTHGDSISPPTNCEVYLVDMVFPEDTMVQLRDNNHFVWIDHHQTAIDGLSHEHFNGIQRVGKAGCVLTWEYFDIMSQKSGKPPHAMPYFVKIVGDFDVWNDQNPYYWNDTVLPIKFALEAERTLPSDSRNIWGQLFVVDEMSDMYMGPCLSKLHEYGSIIKKYVAKKDAEYAKQSAFEGKLDGWRCIILNNGARNGSLAFDAVYDPDKHDIMIGYARTSRGMSYSLYTTKTEYIHVGNIATKYGGGGHAGASGFTVQNNTLPFEIERS